MKNFVTQRGYKQLLDQLTNLKTVEFKNCVNALTDARDKGDISENAEYETAKEAFDNINNRISELENKIKNSSIISSAEIDTDSVGILSTVKVKNNTYNKEQKFTLVPDNEIDIKLGKISYNSPIGAALIGKKVGESLKIKVPSGELNMDVIEITAEYV